VGTEEWPKWLGDVCVAACSFACWLAGFEGSRAWQYICLRRSVDTSAEEEKGRPLAPAAQHGSHQPHGSCPTPKKKKLEPKRVAFKQLSTRSSLSTTEHAEHFWERKGLGPPTHNMRCTFVHSSQQAKRPALRKENGGNYREACPQRLLWSRKKKKATTG